MPQGDPHFTKFNNENNPYFSRQVYARHLYCLMMLTLEASPDFEPTSEDPNLSPAELRRIMARRIAQWAVNVVDFRDPDAVMTPFEFDLDPFDEDGWSVDDNYETQDGTADRAMVWGCESPELLITETLAFHDRRVRDTNLELPEGGGTAQERRPQDNQDQDPDNNVEPDEDLDQFRVPEGSLFIELYCAGNPNVNRPDPDDLYQNGELALDKVTGNSPVWRIAIAKSPYPQFAAGSDALRRARLALTKPAVDPYLEFHPDDESMLLRDLPQIGETAARFVVFTRQAPAPGYFYSQSAVSARLRPGEFAVLGPRGQTHLGSRNRTGLADSDPSVPSQQFIQLSPNELRFNYLAGGFGRRPIDLGMIIAAQPPDNDAALGWEWREPSGSPKRYIGLNASEPHYTEGGQGYYQTPDLDNDGGNSADGSYYRHNELPDQPEDDKQGRPLRRRHAGQ